MPRSITRVATFARYLATGALLRCRGCSKDPLSRSSRSPAPTPAARVAQPFEFTQFVPNPALASTRSSPFDHPARGAPLHPWPDLPFGLHYCSRCPFLMSTPVPMPQTFRLLLPDCWMGPKRPQRCCRPLKRMDALLRSALIRHGSTAPLLRDSPSTFWIGDLPRTGAASASVPGEPMRAVCLSLSQYGFCGPAQARPWPAGIGKATARPSGGPALTDPQELPPPDSASASAVLVPTLASQSDVETQPVVGTRCFAALPRQAVGGRLTTPTGGNDLAVIRQASPPSWLQLGPKKKPLPARCGSKKVPDGNDYSALRGKRHRPGPVYLPAPRTIPRSDEGARQLTPRKALGPESAAAF